MCDFSFLKSHYQIKVRLKSPPTAALRLVYEVPAVQAARGTRGSATYPDLSSVAPTNKRAVSSKY